MLIQINLIRDRPLITGRRGLQNGKGWGGGKSSFTPINGVGAEKVIAMPMAAA